MYIFTRIYIYTRKVNYKGVNTGRALPQILSPIEAEDAVICFLQLVVQYNRGYLLYQDEQNARRTLREWHHWLVGNIRNQAAAAWID